MGEAKRRGTFEQRREKAVLKKGGLPPVTPPAKVVTLKDVPEEVLQNITEIVRTLRVEKGKPIILRKTGTATYSMFTHPDDYDGIINHLGGVLL